MKLSAQLAGWIKAKDGQICFYGRNAELEPGKWTQLIWQKPNLLSVPNRQIIDSSSIDYLDVPIQSRLRKRIQWEFLLR